MTIPKTFFTCYKKMVTTITCLTCTLLTILFTGSIVNAQAQYNPESGDAAYTAEINSMNASLTDGEVTGRASFIVADGQLQITIMAKGLAASMMHLQHIHGFKMADKASSCPATDADINGDDIVDLIETHAASGVTLIPFNGAPAELVIKSSSYPVANEKGLITYRMSVSLDTLKSAIQDAYDIEELSLENRVIYLHGVSEGTALPESVQSLPGVPAQVTVPLACGEIEAL